jgi:hypothetical protein
MTKIVNAFSSESVPLGGAGGSSTFLNNELDTSESTSEDSRSQENAHQIMTELDIAKPES